MAFDSKINMRLHFNFNRPTSVRNRCVIEVYCGVFVLSRCLFYFSVGVGAFVI